MGSKLISFIKRNKYLLGVLTLLVFIVFIVGTQIRVEAPDKVRKESLPYIVGHQDIPDTSIESFEEISEIEGTFGIKSPGKRLNRSSKEGFLTREVSSNVDAAGFGKDEHNKDTKFDKRSSLIEKGKSESSNLDSGKNNKTEDKVQVDKGLEADTSKRERKKLLDFIGNAWSHTGGRYVYLANQKVDESKEIKVSVQVDCLQVLENGVECNDSSAWKYVPSDGIIVKEETVVCHQGENVWDAVARSLNAHSIDYAYTGDSPFTHGIDSISSVYGTCYLYRCNHLEAGNNAENKKGPFGNTYSGWTVTVNGVYPGLGMNGVVLRDGDKIRLMYYTGYNQFIQDEEGNF